MAHGRAAPVRAAVVIIGAVAALTALVSCSPDPQGGAGDAPIGKVETEPWVVLNNVDGFPNVATRCRGSNGIYVTRSAGDSADALVVIPNDPACTGGSGSSTTTTPGGTVPLR
jgi:hypothetical protein